MKWQVYSKDYVSWFLSLHSRVCYVLPVTFTFPVYLALVLVA